MRVLKVVLFLAVVTFTLVTSDAPSESPIAPRDAGDLNLTPRDAGVLSEDPEDIREKLADIDDDVEDFSDDDDEFEEDEEEPADLNEEDDSHEKALCVNGKLILASGFDGLKGKVKISVVDNFRKFKNETQEKNLKFIHHIKGIYEVFSEDKVLGIPHDSELLYPLLIRLSIKTPSCNYPRIKLISLKVVDVKAVQIRIDDEWHPFKNDNAIFKLDFQQPSQADSFDIFVDMKADSKGGIGSLRVLMCCGDA